MLRKLITIFAIFGLFLPIIATADYPNDKTIKIVVPSKAGGSTDTTARLFIRSAKKYWPNADFIVKNVPGSGGQKGFEVISRAKKDGYTIGLIFTTQVVAHIVSKRARYTLDSFHVIGNICQDPEIVVVPKNSKFKNLDEFTNAAKTKSLTVSVNGIGSDDFVAAKKFEELTGVTFNLMPTKGSTEQKAATLGGHVDASFMNFSQMYAQHKAGNVRIIALMDKTRNDMLPMLQTAQEQGYPVDMTATRGFVAPAGVDKEKLDMLDKLLESVLKDPDFIAASKRDVLFLKPMKGVEYLSYLRGIKQETQKFYDKSPW